MFYDLCLSLRSGKDQDREAAVRRAIELGYTTIAWNTNSPAKGSQNLKVPKPFAVSKRLLADMASSRCLAGVQALRSIGDFKQYSRVTLVVDDATDAQALTTGNAALMRFDIVAASPRSLSAFLHLCKQADVDIISLDFSHRMPFHIDQKHVAAAVKRGILFEITHSPVTQSPATRRQLMESTRLVVEYMRGKQFILSSDAENLSQLRGPYDVLNIGCIIGLPEEQARKSLCENCALVLQHAYSRKLRYTSVEILSRPEFKEKWGRFDSLLGPPLGGESKAAASAEEGEGGAVDDALDESDDDSLAAGLVELNRLSNKSSGVESSERDVDSESEENSSEDEENGATSFGSVNAEGSGVIKISEPDVDDESESTGSSASGGFIVRNKSRNPAPLGDDIWKFENKPLKKRESSGGALADLDNSKYKFMKKGINSASGASVSREGNSTFPAKKNKRPLSVDEQSSKKKKFKK